SGNDVLCLGAICIDDRGLTGLEQLGKKAELRLQISVNAWMIVHVIAAEIGEGRRRELDAVETVLIEAVRGCLEGEMGDAFVYEFRKHGVQRYRVRRSQRAIDGAAGFHDADRSDGSRVMTER